MQLDSAEYKMISVTLKTPGQIQVLLSDEGQEGWHVQAVGSSFLFLGRTPGAKLETQIVSITLRSPKAILGIIEDQNRGGWRLGSLGSNYLFFNRDLGEAGPLDFEYKMENIILKTPGGILEMANGYGENGWEIKGIGASLMVMQRRTDKSMPRRHLLENITLKTPAALQDLVAKKASAGWSLSGVSRLFMAFSQPRSLSERAAE